MAIELHIFVQDTQVPTREDWQREIEGLGLPAALDPGFDPRGDVGFVPMTYKGQSAGFEYSLELSADILPSYSHIALRVGSRDRCATFRWGSNLTECAAALSAAAALVKHSDGVYFYPADDILHDADEAVESIRKDLSSLPF